MRLLCLFAAALNVAALSFAHNAAAPTAALPRAELDDPFLLQVSYEQTSIGFNTSRSRIVTFERDGATLHMLDVSDTEPGVPAEILATIPIRTETPRTLHVDLNDGFDTVYREEDRTGEDYYGRIDRHDSRAFRLIDRQPLAVSHHNGTLVFDQQARTEDGQGIVVHYYLSPYHPRPDFRRFEMKNLRRFGFYETYPQWRSDRWVLYAMKFDIHEPIVFALSSDIPDAYRSAVRDGVMYWNRAFGTSVVRVIDAPPGVRAPSPDYNVIQWVTSGAFASTSYVQSDPLTGEILHAHIFVLPETMADGNLAEQSDHLRYIVAHEVGHALGLRHNFASREPMTVMNYFRLPQIREIGGAIRMRAPALPYDTAIVQHVYLGASLDATALPPFCTDSQPGCSPFRPTPKESDAIRGGGPSADVNALGN